MSAEPRLAAACILVRDDEKLLLGRRNPALKFMGGYHVFPGGRIELEEDIARVRGAADEEHARAVLAAAREVFEETGLLCVRGVLPDRESLRQNRQRLLAGEVRFDEIMARHDLIVAADDFEPAGNWVTPAFAPIRFDTRYFLHRVTAGQSEELIEGEIVALDWLTAAEARQRWHRGELQLPPPVAWTLRQMAALELPAAIPALNRPSDRAPGEHNLFEIRRGILMVPVKSATIPPATHTNCIIVGEQSLVVIDPGAEDPAERAHLNNQIDALIELGGRLEAILLTHSHPDHTAGAVELRERYGVPILAHAATAAQLSFSIDRTLADGEVLTCGGDPEWRLECLHTPGHDPGHLCFLETTTGTLLAGDMAANPGTIIVSRRFGGDMGDFLASLERLLDVPAKLLVPSHGHAGRPQEMLRQQLDHRLWREAKIKQIYESGVESFHELLAKAYDDAPPAALPLARHALDAHLAKLGIDLPATW